MAVEPIEARCRDCGRELLLAQLVRTGSATCPWCGTLLAPGYSLLLLEEARKADALQRDLVLCLQRLVGLPGPLELEPESVFRNAVAAVSWQQLLEDDRDVIRAEADALRPRVRAWRCLARHDRRRQAPAVVAAIRRLAERLRRHGQLLDQRRSEFGAGSPDVSVGDADAVWHAAKQVDDAAEAVAGDRRLADDVAYAALDVARAGVGPPEHAPGRSSDPDGSRTEATVR